MVFNLLVLLLLFTDFCLVCLIFLKSNFMLESFVLLTIVFLKSWMRLKLSCLRTRLLSFKLFIIFFCYPLTACANLSFSLVYSANNLLYFYVMFWISLMSFFSTCNSFFNVLFRIYNSLRSFKLISICLTSVTFRFTMALHSSCVFFSTSFFLLILS